jgi:capsular polysaccharide biosynthesis protein
MELRRYAQILRRRWAIALVAFLVTFAATLMLVLPQPWIYESEGSLVVTPRPGLNAEELIRALETLNGNPTIPATYAQLAGSDFMFAKVESALPTATDTSDVEVTSAVVIDTNVITITVVDTDPQVAHDVADELIDQMITYAGAGDGTYLLVASDAPKVPDNPSGPNKNLMIAAGLLLGFALAMGLALLAEYLRRPAEELAIDDPVTGLRNELYLRERLHEELARTKRTEHTTAVCLVRLAIRTGENDDVSHAPTPKDLRRISRGLRLTVAPDAVLASLAGGVFVVLLPDSPRAKADGLRDGWEAAIRALLEWASQGELGPRLQITGGTGEIHGGKLIGSSEVETALRPLAGPDLVSAETPAGSAGAQAAPALAAPAARAAAPAPGAAPARTKAPAPTPAHSGAPARTEGTPRAERREPQEPREAQAPVVIPEMPPAPREATITRGPGATTVEAPVAEPPAQEQAETSALRRSKRSKAARTAAASTNGDEVAPAEDPDEASEDRDGGGGSSREPREETSRAGDRSG